MEGRGGEGRAGDGRAGKWTGRGEDWGEGRGGEKFIEQLVHA